MSAVNTFGATGLLSRHVVSGSASTFYTFDERGNVSQRLNSSGTVQSTDVYDAYGTRTSTASTQPDPWGFEGQDGYYTDSETGLLLCTHRYYDPSTGRFVTRDPMGYDGGINLYGYTGNDSVNATDESGFQSLSSVENPGSAETMQGIAQDMGTNPLGNPSGPPGGPFGGPIRPPVPRPVLPPRPPVPPPPAPPTGPSGGGSGFGNALKFIGAAALGGIIGNKATLALDKAWGWLLSHPINPVPQWDPGHPWLGPNPVCHAGPISPGASHF